MFEGLAQGLIGAGVSHPRGVRFQSLDPQRTRPRPTSGCSTASPSTSASSFPVALILLACGRRDRCARLRHRRRRVTSTPDRPAGSELTHRGSGRRGQRRPPARTAPAERRRFRRGRRRPLGRRPPASRRCRTSPSTIKAASRAGGSRRPSADDGGGAATRANPNMPAAFEGVGPGGQEEQGRPAHRDAMAVTSGPREGSEDTEGDDGADGRGQHRDPGPGEGDATQRRSRRRRRRPAVRNGVATPASSGR